MFQVTNARDFHIVHASIKAAIVYMDEPDPEDELSEERIFDLNLVRSVSPAFLMNWVVMHIIDSKSPLVGMTSDDFKRKNARILISLTGIDDWSSQTFCCGCRTPLYKRIFPEAVST